MIKRIKSEKIVFPDGVRGGSIYIENGKIIAAGDAAMPYDEEYDFGGDLVLAGFTDIHTHGAAGYDYAEADEKGIIEAVKYSAKRGATGVMPTVSSSSFDKTYAALERIERAMHDERYGGIIKGAHLEGPYFSPKQSGAQDPEYITEPIEKDYKRIIGRFGGIIKRWDFAPERDKGGKFCEYLTKHGILPSAGHTDAKYDDMLVAMEKGCRLVTHLYSCTSTVTREKGYRKLGVTECAYLFDDLYAEIIADGKHLPEELIRLVFKLKRKDRIILITDSLKVAGTSAKEGKLGGVGYVIDDGVCKLTDGSAFAGSIATVERLIKVCIAAGIDITDIARAGAENPARLFGLCSGRIEKGYDADIIALDKEYGVKKAFIKGEELK
ncbi:MAG TPA: N-acetylglucosamine-6-phosphate deacetylase [Clostridiales bacterium]|nr:N-acetylglucosamine-6-phosphate deacetylase [Clostridiales bacterium]